MKTARDRAMVYEAMEKASRGRHELKKLNAEALDHEDVAQRLDLAKA